MKREARKNRKMLKHFAGVVRQVKEKKKVHMITFIFPIAFLRVSAYSQFH